MSNESKNGYVKMSVFVLVLSIFLGVLGIIWNKLEKIDDSLSDVKTDIAVIKQRIDYEPSISTFINKR